MFWGETMKRLSMLLGLCCLLLAGCEPTTQAECYRDAAAIDFALATMTDGSTPNPQPEKCPRCGGAGWITHGDGHKTPCPDCQDGSAGPYGGPLDTLRGAKDLIRKGNESADRSKELLDRAERDGKIRLDIHLPEPAPPLGSPAHARGLGGPCPGGVCPYVPDLPPPFAPDDSCWSGSCPQVPDSAPTVTEATVQPATSGYRRGIWQPRLFRRWRR